MKIFISWSGKLSEKIATTLNDWIPNVLQTAETFVSSDIAKGNTWFESISAELKNTDYGIICITEENSRSPWLNFEAGALFIKLNSSKVCPFLYDLQPSDIDGPLQQLQATVYTKEDVFKLINSLNDSADNKLSYERLKNIFEKYWPDLQQSFNNINIEKIQFENNKQLKNDSISDVNLKDILSLKQTKSNKNRAAEVLWDDILTVRESGEVLFTFFYALLEEEYNQAFTNRKLQLLLKQFSEIEIMSKINSNSHNVEKYRPFISEYLWELYIEFKKFIGRNVFLFGKGIREKNIIDWRKDKFICNSLDPFLEDDEKKLIYSVRSNAFGIVVERLESKILSEISKLISGNLDKEINPTEN